MKRWQHASAVFVSAAALSFGSPRVIHAQFSPGMGGQGGGAPQSTKPDTPEGPAEAAPEDDKDDDLTEEATAAWPKQEKKKLQFFELDGYFRFRGEMFHNFNLGQVDVTGTTPRLRAPFYRPISEAPGSPVSCEARKTQPVPGGGERNPDDGCPGNNLTGANIRLRLEPTINVTERVAVHAQFDVFDNLILGSTPDRWGAANDAARANYGEPIPATILSEGQAPPIAGRNTSKPAIVAKRAWGEVSTPVGLLSFGRMPWQWGLGMVANDGSCWNCNYGDTIDRVMLATNYAHHTFGFAYDFAATGPNNANIESARTYYERSTVDLEQMDDMHQLWWMAGRMDPEDVIEEKVANGDLVLNYGVFLLWRGQTFDYKSAAGYGMNEATLAEKLIERRTWTLTPDLWFKLRWRKLHLEFEGALTGGKLRNFSESEAGDHADIIQYGWSFKFFYKFLQDTLKVGLDVGMASGSADDLRTSSDPKVAYEDVDRRRAYNTFNPQLCGAARGRPCKITEFRFDYDYQVDLILFREILGTVANATYFKPWIQYDPLENIGGRFDIMYAMANQPLGFPGNSRSLGLELDLSLYYRNVEDGFYAGLRYGVLFPFGSAGALARPAEIYGPNLAAPADIAQTFLANMVITF